MLAPFDVQIWKAPLPSQFAGMAARAVDFVDAVGVPVLIETPYSGICVCPGDTVSSVMANWRAARAWWLGTDKEQENCEGVW